MFYVYILQSLKNNKTYVGYTYEINQRLYKHNKGFVRSTKNERPLKLLISEEYETKAEAKKRELW
jgi:putative endonuclease